MLSNLVSRKEEFLWSERDLSGLLPDLRFANKASCQIDSSSFKIWVPTQ